MASPTNPNRRHFLAVAIGSTSIATGRWDEEKPEEEVTPAEDLMREHGLLKRILLIYAESVSRLDAGSDFHPEAISESAGIIRSFIEDYHERLEEEHLFPRFRKVGKLVDLVDVLEAQHKAGRRLTEAVLRLPRDGAARAAADRKNLSESLRAFIRMYAPHEAREDTVLFPALHEVFTGSEYEKLGDRFEEREHKLFGEEGFEKMVVRVAEIEKRLGIYELTQFTPRSE